MRFTKRPLYYYNHMVMLTSQSIVYGFGYSTPSLEPGYKILSRESLSISFWQFSVVDLGYGMLLDLGSTIPDPGFRLVAQASQILGPGSVLQEA